MKKTSIRLFTVLAVFLVIGLLTSCVPGDGRNTPEEPAHFLWGIWHGWIAPVSLIISLFRPGISIYEVNNTGFWYEFGFYIAIISGFGGVSVNRKRKKGCKDRDD